MHISPTRNKSIFRAGTSALTGMNMAQCTFRFILKKQHCHLKIQSDFDICYTLLYPWYASLHSSYNMLLYDCPWNHHPQCLDLPFFLIDPSAIGLLVAILPPPGLETNKGQLLEARAMERTIHHTSFRDCLRIYLWFVYDTWRWVSNQGMLTAMISIAIDDLEEVKTHVNRREAMIINAVWYFRCHNLFHNSIHGLNTYFMGYHRMLRCWVKNITAESNRDGKLQ